MAASNVTVTKSKRLRIADEIWATDLMYLKVGDVQYYLVTFIDEYSRYLVHWELLTKHGRTLGQHRGAARDRNVAGWG